jgi:hypothetical protein
VLEQQGDARSGICDAGYGMQDDWIAQRAVPTSIFLPAISALSILFISKNCANLNMGVGQRLSNPPPVIKNNFRPKPEQISSTADVSRLRSEAMAAKRG